MLITVDQNQMYNTSTILSDQSNPLSPLSHYFDPRHQKAGSQSKTNKIDITCSSNNNGFR
jgi:hypothetical protein